MSNLIDRYVWAVSEHLPENLRKDVADELRTTIEDMAEARDSADPTREVLHELGDPAALARSYAGDRRHLIGPQFYGDYVRLLRSLAGILLPLLLVVFLVVELWDPDQALIPGVIGAVGSTFEVALHILFWTTLVFVIMERSGLEPVGLDGARGKSWNPDSLPAVPSRRQITLGDLVVGLVMLLTPVVLLLWQRFRPIFNADDGSSIPLVHPDLWSAWMPALFVLIVINIAVEVWKYREGRWTLPVTIANSVLNVAWVGFIAAMVTTQEMINPEFTEAMGDAGNSWNPEVVGIVAIVVAAIICIWDSADSFVKHMRVRRDLAG